MGRHKTIKNEERQQKKGKWEKKETLRYIYFVCSKCKGELSWKGRYCPYCGSEMETDNE